MFVFHKPYPIAQESELVPIPAQLLRKPETALKGRAAAIEAFVKMAEAAKRENVEIIIFSSHRGYQKQDEFFKDAEKRHGRGKGILWLAPPGYSEHHTGYVFDIGDRGKPEADDESIFESTAAFHWLAKNAKNFSFELSFPKNNWQGVGYEPWHWKFTGDNHSKSLFHPHFLKKIIVVTQAIVNGLVKRLSL